MNLIVLHAELPGIPAVQGGQTPRQSNSSSQTVKVVANLVKKILRCFSPPPVRDRRFIEWDLPTRPE